LVHHIDIDSFILSTADVPSTPSQLGITVEPLPRIYKYVLAIHKCIHNYFYRVSPAVTINPKLAITFAFTNITIARTFYDTKHRVKFLNTGKIKDY